MRRHRLLLALVSVTLVATACGDDDDSGAETVPLLPTAPVTTVGATATVPGSTVSPTSVPETPASLTMPATTVPPPTTAATTVPATTVVATTVAAETTAEPETTAAPDTTVPDTTEAPETTVVDTTVAPETTAAPESTAVETTLAPETTVVETTLAPETTLSPDTTVATSVPISDVVLLNQDGLGLVTFGDEPEATIAAVTAVLGAPTEDTGWSDPLSISTCPGTEVRRVSWGALSLFFGDESPIASGTPHLFAYSYGNPEDLEATPTGLATPEGIGLGSTVQFLEAAYPEVVIEPGEEGIIEPNFFVNDSLSGFLTGGNDDDLVTTIVGGDRCGM